MTYLLFKASRDFSKFWGLLVLACHAAACRAEASLEAQRTLIERGAYIAREADCAACHIGPNGTPFAGGKAIHSPLGAIIATNITPSTEFGIGNWDEATFARAIRRGVSPRGHLYPAMPYTSYAGMSDEDVHALYTYLKSGVEPVERGPSVETKLPFPFSMRPLMMGWNMIYARGKPQNAALSETPSVARGRYLVEVMGHCSVCHTPRDALLGEDKSRHLGGAVVGGWFAPNITSDPVSGIGGWSEDELFTFLSVGAVSGKAQASGSMAEAVEHGLNHLRDNDLRSIAQYLKTVKPIRDPAQTVPSFARRPLQEAAFEAMNLGANRTASEISDASSIEGEQIFMGACASCHQIDGAGTKDQFYPSLFANTATGGISPRNVVMTILSGVHRDIKGHVVSMPAFDGQLNDAQVAAVSNYVFQRFGNPQLSVTAQDVDQFRKGDDRPLYLTMLMRLGGIATSGGVAAAGALSLALLERRTSKRKSKAKAHMVQTPD